jgi:hypothetical protein
MCKKLFYLVSFLLVISIALTDTVKAELVGWWMFDERSGTTAFDSSGNENHGLLRGSPRWVAGKIGGALEFDGRGDYVDTGNAADLPVWTICAWVISPDAPSGAMPSGPIHREKNYQINWNHFDTTFRSAAALNVGGVWYAASLGRLEANTWYHLVATYNRQVLRAYKNGVLITSNSAPSGNPSHEWGTLKFARHSIESQYFGGTIDDVRIYNKVLTLQEIREAMRGDTFVAYNPVPPDGATHTDTWINLSWTPSSYAVSHDVYLGDNFDEVNDGTGGTFRGNQTATYFVVGLPGFPYPDGLVSGTTYYWRIEEVASDGTTTKGDVWSFTTSYADAGLKVKYGGGTGVSDDPYLIYTAEQMNEIGANPGDWDKHFKLMADIDLSAFTGTDFNLIGYYQSDDDREPFTGVFDGNGHTISNFSYRTWYMLITEGIGLFRYVGGTDMEIKDLGLIDPNVVATSGEGVGSLVGIMEYGAITNCYVQNGHISGNTWVGGLAGRIYVCTIIDCHVEADVSGFTKIGGLVGENYAGLIKNCSSASDVFGTSKIGGLVGVNEFLMEQGFYIPGNITGCCAEGKMEGLNCFGGLVGDNLGRVTDSYATADIFVSFVFQIDGPPGGNRFGGLVGHNYFWTEALIPPSVSRCYSTGSITESILGTENVGGLVGLNEGTVTDSFWDIETSGLSNSDGGRGRTTFHMQRQSTFINAGWDFVDETANGTEDIWRILENRDYPRLNWELIDEEPVEVDDSLSGALDTDLSFTTSGDVGWFSQMRRWYHDGDAAQSGGITHDQESWLQTSVDGAGTVSFFWKVSSEGNYDCLEFYIDGTLQDQISGSEDWHNMTYDITGSASHTLEWRYFKDGGMSRGDDCGWVDKVEWVSN